MKPFDQKFTKIDSYLDSDRKPDFNNILKVLKREKPDRLTLFEFFLNDDLYDRLTVKNTYAENDPDIKAKKTIDAFKTAGYDFVTILGSELSYHRAGRKDKLKSISLNDGAVIYDWESFEKYDWPDADACDYSALDRLGAYLPDGMKFIIFGEGGVLENVMWLLGFENACLMTRDDPKLLQAVFDKVGSEFVKYYKNSASYSSVGALISDDDWGFNSQTMLSVEEMRKYVVPWHKKIVEVIHLSGKPAILHSCGNLEAVMDDIIDEIGYDGKHSFEDKILLVEKAYDKYSSRIAILGGLDVDFLCRSSPEEIYRRAVAMIEKTDGKGGYALGSGNSIPYYVPEENYFAMIAAALFN